MGQFYNQPDFATTAVNAVPTDTISSATSLNSAALYIGVGGDVTVILNGVDPSVTGLPLSSQSIVFKNVPDGSFLPVMTNYVLASGTTATSIIAIQ